MTKDPHSLIATIKAYLHAVFVSLKKNTLFKSGKKQRIYKYNKPL